jgi:hypothetical protein
MTGETAIDSLQMFAKSKTPDSYGFDMTSKCEKRSRVYL